MEFLGIELAHELTEKGMDKNRIIIVGSIDDALVMAQGEGLKTYHKLRGKRDIAKHWAHLVPDLKAARLI